jgi:hypothetical protein
MALELAREKLRIVDREAMFVRHGSSKPVGSIT